MRNHDVYLEQVAHVLSRFTDEALRGRRKEMVDEWVGTKFDPVLIGEWISLGVWNPSVAAFLWDSNMLPAHLLEDRVSPALIEAACSGKSPPEDIVKLFFGGHLKTKDVKAVAYSHAERVAHVLSRFTDEALRGRREEMVRRWIATKLDPILVSAWLSAGVWNPEAADELWDQGVGPVDVFECQIPRDVIEAVCAGQRDAGDVTEMVSRQ